MIVKLFFMNLLLIFKIHIFKNKERISFILEQTWDISKTFIFLSFRFNLCLINFYDNNNI